MLLVYIFYLGAYRAFQKGEYPYQIVHRICSQSHIDHECSILCITILVLLYNSLGIVKLIIK